jgi:hypothetical protein
MMAEERRRDVARRDWGTAFLVNTLRAEPDLRLGLDHFARGSH